jgi:hypothetical protein
MAKWSFWIALAAGASIVLSAVGLALISRILLYTRQAAVQAREAVVQAKLAAKAAEKAVDVTREMGIAQTRAYLTVAGATVAYVGDRYIPRIDLVLRNTGQSPAFNVAFAFKTNRSKARMKAADPDDLGEMDISVTQTSIIDLIGARAEQSIQILLHDDIVLAKAGDMPPTNLELQVEGVVEYTTVFERRNGEVDRLTSVSLISNVHIDRVKAAREHSQKVMPFRMRIIGGAIPGWVPDYRTTMDAAERAKALGAAAGEASMAQ